MAGIVADLIVRARGDRVKRVADVSEWLDPGVGAALASVGIDGPHTPLVALGGGRHHDVYVTRAGGRDLVVKLSRAARARHGVASWVNGRLSAVGVPAPAVVAYGVRLRVESRCEGMPLDLYHACHQRLAEFAAATAGELLRRVHAVPVRGYGRLNHHGGGSRLSLHGWFYQLPPFPGRASGELHTLRARAQQLLHRHAALLEAVPARLLHGEWAARHIVVDAGRITGIVGWENARGGDPLADLARWSLVEPADLTRALFAGYFTIPPDQVVRRRLTLHRVRACVEMLARHIIRGEQGLVALRQAQLRADLTDGLDVWSFDRDDYRLTLDVCC